MKIPTVAIVALVLIAGTGTASGAASAQPKVILFLVDDIGETKNLAAQAPGKVEQLEALIAGFLAGGEVVPKPNPRYDPRAESPPAKLAK